LLQFARDDGIVRGVHHHIEAFLNQHFGGFQRFAHIREEGVRIAQHFELHQLVIVEQFTRQTQGADRIVGAVTAGRVGQIGKFGRRQIVEQAGLAGVLTDVYATDRHGDDLGAGRINRGAGFRKVFVFAGADQ